MNDKIKEEQKKPLILIVDDAPRNLQVLGNILRKEDYKISVASSGQQALDITGSILPDLFLLDVMMPELNGFEVCKQLKASPKTKDIPVIFLTAKTETVDIIEGFKLGAVDYVIKPFNSVELLARVNTHLKLRKAQKEIINLEQKKAVFAMAVTTNHEINQPLTVLKGNFELLQNSIDKINLTAKQHNFLLKIENSIEKIETILKKFNDFESIDFESYINNKELLILKEKKDK